MTATTLLADDLLLVLLDPVTGKFRAGSPKLEYGLAGALLVELALAERVAVDGQGRRARVVVVDAARPADALLADALQRVGEKARRADTLIPLLAKRLRDRLLERAEQRGDLRRERLTLRPDRWPAADPTRQAELRARLDAVLVTGVTPDPRTAALVAVLGAVDAAAAAVEAPDRAARKAVARRAAEIGEGAWAADSVRRAVAAAAAAVTASTAAVTAAAIASS
jgi:chromosomal replication initiation ATPase DnaA